MIGRLRGVLAEQDDTCILVECAGVGYEVFVSTHTLISLPATGEEVTLRVFTHMMENKITLYGFGSALERDLFDLLITVKKVGPASAVGILSGGAGPIEIAQLIAEGSVGQLIKLRGVGKKTAEMLVVELREKCEDLLTRSGASARIVSATQKPVGKPASKPDRPPILDDVAAALVQLGWRPAEADKVVADLEVNDKSTLESLIRKALRSMPR
jgi:Holliday junction DNA helicase RuvA